MPAIFVNPFTDFGFKKLFGEEVNKEFDAAEIAKFSSKERMAYQEALKTYRDFINVVGTAVEEAVEVTIEDTYKKMAVDLLRAGVKEKIIAQATGWSIERVQRLKKSLKKP